ncbi:MAG: hypothetical protein Q3999_04790 [Buchananella hordeovulneris]|nr:hypothetical protein [Buchananella hordeovulneris]
MERQNEPANGKFTLQAIAWLLAFGIGLPVIFHLALLGWSWLAWGKP